MEIKNINELEMCFSENKITSLIIKNEELLKNLLNENYNKINEVILKEQVLFNINILEDIKYYLKEFNQDKLIEFLNSFNLDETILDKCYIELSASEVKKIILCILLLEKTKKIILLHPTENLDVKSIQTLQKHLKKLKRNNKSIIIISYDTNFMLESSDKIILVDNNKKIYDGDKYEMLSDKQLLEKLDLKVPNILNFVNKAKELKNIKLGFSDNINDLIKDIYRYAK